MTLSVSTNNGQAPASALAAMPGFNGDGSRQTSPTQVVASYGRLRSAMTAAGMGDLVPSSGWSCYRDRAAQQHMRDLGLTTIPVGQSIHGEWTFGGAVDFANLGGFGAARHNWLRANGGAFGWYQPGWAQAGGSLPESWHWEYDQRTDQHIGDDDMPSADEVAAAVWAYPLQRPNGPVADAGTYVVDSRVLLGDPAATVNFRVADQVWASLIERPNGPAVDAGTYLVDTRASVAPVTSGPVLVADQVWAATPSSYGAGRDWTPILILVILLALVIGLAVGVVTMKGGQVTDDGVFAGVGTLIGGIVAAIVSAISTRRSGRHSE